MRPQKSKEKVVQDGGLFLGFLKMDIGDIKDKTSLQTHFCSSLKDNCHQMIADGFFFFPQGVLQAKLIQT